MFLKKEHHPESGRPGSSWSLWCSGQNSSWLVSTLLQIRTISDPREDRLPVCRTEPEPEGCRSQTIPEDLYLDQNQLHFRDQVYKIFLKSWDRFVFVMNSSFTRSSEDPRFFVYMSWKKRKLNPNKFNAALVTLTLKREPL